MTKPHPATVLVVDDEPRILMLIEAHLARDGHNILTATTGPQALELMEAHAVDLVLTDIQMPAMTGLELMTLIRQGWGSDVFLIAMTAYGSIDNQARSLQAGADEYLEKPFDMRELRQLVVRCLQLQRLQRARRQAHLLPPHPVPHHCLVGLTAPMRAANEALNATVHKHTPVMIEGPPGSGKSLAAGYLHAAGPKKRQEFLHVPCAVLPSAWIGAELFTPQAPVWSEKYGTVWLEEFTVLPREFQRALLVKLDELSAAAFGPRLVVTSSEDIERLVGAGQVSVRLYWKLADTKIVLPPLRERLDDLPALLETFVAETCAQLGRPPLPFQPEVIDALCRFDWPGNIGQLFSLVEHAVVFCARDELTPADFPLTRSKPEVDFNHALEMTRRLLALGQARITKALEQCGGVPSRAAAILGVSAQALRCWAACHQSQPDHQADQRDQLTPHH